MSNANKDKYLPHPTRCDNCGSTNIELKDVREFSPASNRSYPIIWHCNRCRANVGCHPNTSIPLGYMATSKTRLQRKRAHRVFDQLYSVYKIASRTECYNRLAHLMGIPKSECHFAYFDEAQCKLAIQHCRDAIRRHKKKDTEERYIQGKRISSKNLPKKGKNYAFSKANSISHKRASAKRRMR